jgi:DNA polymerase theta
VEVHYELTQLGAGILRSGLAPEEGLLVYDDLKRAQGGLILSNELHMLYLLTPVSLAFRVDWRLYHKIFKRLSPVEQRICEKIGIDEELIVAYAHSNSGGVSNEITNFKKDVIM